MTKSVIAIIIMVLVLLEIFLFLARKPQVEVESLVPASTPISSPIPTAMPAITELKIEDIKVGTESAQVKPGDIVVMHYVGILTNGTKFDSSLDRGQPFETQIGVGQVIKGWDEGVVGMKVGGIRRLYVPSSMAYGESGAGAVIPPNSDLIFEVQLLEIK